VQRSPQILRRAQDDSSGPDDSSRLIADSQPLIADR
jgi:hypothetical protein